MKLTKGLSNSIVIVGLIVGILVVSSLSIVYLDYRSTTNQASLTSQTSQASSTVYAPSSSLSLTSTVSTTISTALITSSETSSSSQSRTSFSSTSKTSSSYSSSTTTQTSAPKVNLLSFLPDLFGNFSSMTVRESLNESGYEPITVTSSYNVLMAPDVYFPTQGFQVNSSLTITAGKQVSTSSLLAWFDQSGNATTVILNNNQAYYNETADNVALPFFEGMVVGELFLFENNASSLQRLAQYQVGLPVLTTFGSTQMNVTSYILTNLANRNSNLTSIKLGIGIINDSLLLVVDFSESGPNFSLSLDLGTVGLALISPPPIVGKLSLPGGYPNYVAFDPENGLMYITDQGAGLISIVNATTDSLVGTISDPGGPNQIVYDPANHFLYVADWNAGNVSVIDPRNNTIVLNIRVGSDPDAIAFANSSDDLYVANYESSTISVIDNSDSVVDTFGASQPWSLGYDATENLMYIGSYGSGETYPINCSTNEMVTGFPILYSDVHGFTYDPTNQKFYVAISGMNEIGVIVNHSIYSIAVGNFPTSVAYDPSNQLLFVVDQGSNAVSVINATLGSVIRTLPIAGVSPWGVAVDKVNGQIYVVDSATIDVTILSPRG